MSNKNEISTLESALAGGAAGAITRAAIQPLDVLKVRFQLQLEPLKKGSKYSSMFQATRTIIKQEGVSTLWSGHIPAQLLSISYGLIQFSVFEKLIKICEKADPQFFHQHRHGINFSCGATAATVATIASFPFDTLRTRLIAEEKTKKAYRGFVNACLVMVRVEGTSALFKGITPTLAQMAPYAGIQFTVYKFLTNNMLNKIVIFQRNDLMSHNTSSTLGNIVAGSTAGIISKTVIYPFDLIKKRLQIQGFQEHRKGFGKQIFCNGLFNCVNLTVTQEGFLALYKGYVPSIAKAMTVSALYFTIYDEIKYFLIRGR